MPDISRRHLLLVASQCESMPHLEHLKEAADTLHQVLTDRSLGQCQSGLPDGRSLLCGELDADSVRQEIRSAIEHASRHAATLVLCLLGHGFVPGEGDPTLYLMTWHSVSGIRRAAVNVAELLLEAADHPGVNGVLAVVDTCHAAAAVSALPGLLNGTRAGRAPFAVLAAATAPQEAFDLCFSRSLAQVLREGTPHSGPHQKIDELQEALEKALTQ